MPEQRLPLAPSLTAPAGTPTGAKTHARGGEAPDYGSAVNRPIPRASAPISLRAHFGFLLGSVVVLLLLFFLLRLALLVHNQELIHGTPAAALAEAFFNGLRFDLRVVTFICLPLVLSFASTHTMAARGAHRLWLTACASVVLLLGVIELDFYREFHQRLNKLFFQYFKEDPATVLSMVWHGFPVVRYVFAWLAATALLAWLFHRLDHSTRPCPTESMRGSAHPGWRWLALLLGVVVSVAAARGTLRQGPPLRWGDAFTTDSMFANHLGLNGALTLYDAAKHELSDQRKRAWQDAMADGEAAHVIRERLLTAHDTLVDAGQAAVRRTYVPPAATALPVRNVVVILLESFAGRYVGALGDDNGITPQFDRLAREGLLFTRMFSNGTHTHQGMFATMACFPNLPGFEYLMQTPEGAQKFSGLPQLLGARGFDDLYVYNGDFAWDNQAGFFSNQGMTTFIGRRDFVNPVFSDPTWGVSDQDMFDRAITELRARGDKPFYALLQSLSNHSPYALPDPLPVEPVTGHGAYDQHLTAMRYSDWALGRFFEQARQLPSFKETLFVLVGDHGFGGVEQLTDMDLLRFHVPLLLIAPGIQEKFGATRDVVGTQVDVVPTIMGRLGGAATHQCWGRDLLALPAGDTGFGVIKPSGGSQTVAILEGDTTLVLSEDRQGKLYRYRVGATSAADTFEDAARQQAMTRRLEAFVHAATRSLLENTAGVSTAHTTAAANPPHRPVASDR
ncbi:LTA synthase family protein [Thauera aromatica]|uniref:LTA synthase family protein n=1 Tax=Thauera aromatica TaxID=59405 RepID=UPI001FFD94B4|nr:LTA synthase family protein [Thauera aromatica]MCK2097007.1 LTA synthase family protein [Thauera aromatica]